MNVREIKAFVHRSCPPPAFVICECRREQVALTELRFPSAERAVSTVGLEYGRLSIGTYQQHVVRIDDSPVD